MEEFGETGLGNAVYGKAIFAAEIDEVGHTENAELLGCEGLGDIESFGQFAYVRLSIAELRYEHEPYRMRKRFQDFRNVGSPRNVALQISHFFPVFTIEILRYDDIVIFRGDHSARFFLCQ
jgi:hypothetical protein